MTVSMMGIIAAALAGILIQYFKTTVDTQARLTESQDVQLAASYWQRDVASIGVRIYDAGTKTFPLQQSVGTTPACSLPGGTVAATLAWTEFTSLDSTDNGRVVTVSYVAVADGAGFDLERVRCTGATVDSTTQVAHSLTAVPNLTCNVSCTGTGANVPTLVNLGLTVRDPDGNGTTNYTATLTGERRQS